MKKIRHTRARLKTSFSRRAGLALFVVILPVLLGSIQPPSGKDAAGRVFTDNSGRRVTIRGEVQRVVSLSPASTEVLYALGGGDKVAGVTDFCNYPEEAKSKPSVGGFSEINVEIVISLSPDLVLATTLYSQELVPDLEQLGITVAIIDPQTVAGVGDSILLIGRMCGLEKEAQLLAAELQKKQQRIAKAVQGLKRPSVFWELSNDLWTAGPGSFIDDLITQAGGSNVAANAGAPWLQLNGEVLLDANPDYIFLADQPFGETPATVSKRPGWDKLTAVLKKQIVEVKDVDLISRPGPRVMEALEYIARCLHPEVFK